ncbi:acylphosphatase [Pedococcus sp.]|jgi:acylphosphatase|uniref:acylphosphatase n=1 Tax=Pedococcus sp. TaxID=2860345 RepID=UPI002E1422A1|nr:acylphosphatase [Pedococcus sp.]
MDENGSARAVIWVHGRVQGVGFRWWTRARALELGLVGHARNAGDGRVEVVAQGEAGKIRQLMELLEEKPSRHLRPGQVETCATTWGPPREDLRGFIEK